MKKFVEKSSGILKKMGDLAQKNRIDLRFCIVYTQERDSRELEKSLSQRKCGRGGIGRHTILRGWRGDPCEFESRRPHQKMENGPLVKRFNTAAFHAVIQGFESPTGHQNFFVKIKNRSLLQRRLFFLLTVVGCRIERKKGGKGDSSAFFFPLLGHC